MSMYGKNYYNIVISLQLIKINGKNKNKNSPEALSLGDKLAFLNWDIVDINYYVSLRCTICCKHVQCSIITATARVYHSLVSPGGRIFLLLQLLWLSCIT